MLPGGDLDGNVSSGQGNVAAAQ
jgi:hypothetical protein